MILYANAVSMGSYKIIILCGRFAAAKKCTSLIAFSFFPLFIKQVTVDPKNHTGFVGTSGYGLCVVLTFTYCSELNVMEG